LTLTVTVPVVEPLGLAESHDPPVVESVYARVAPLLVTVNVFEAGGLPPRDAVNGNDVGLTLRLGNGGDMVRDIDIVRDTPPNGVTEMVVLRVPSANPFGLTETEIDRGVDPEVGEIEIHELLFWTVKLTDPQVLEAVTDCEGG